MTITDLQLEALGTALAQRRNRSELLDRIAELESQHRSDTEALEKMMAVLCAVPDSYTIQSCCLCYGGGSFPGPIKDALLCYQTILQSRIKEAQPSFSSKP